MEESGANEDKHVTVRMRTLLPAPLRVAAAPVSVPATITRFGFSTVINHMLQLESARVFDVLLDGVLLRGTLQEALLRTQQSTEAVVDVEYTLLVPPPQLQDTLPQPAWVHALCSLPDTVLAGCYDGCIHAHAASATCKDSKANSSVSAAQAHSGGVCAMTGLGQHTEDEYVLSGGKDATACLWRCNGQSLLPCVRLEAHTDAVECVAAQRNQCATAGWDASICIWPWQQCLERSSDSEADGAAAKRARTNSGSAAVDSTIQSEVGCSAQLQGHKQAVCGLAWASTGELYSCSMDHTTCKWDVHAGRVADTMATGKAQLCVSVPPADTGGNSAGVVATGGADGVLRLWDTRAAGQEQLALKAYQSAALGMPTLAWRPGAAHTIAAASYDGSVALWDIRSAMPLSTLLVHEGKVLALAWQGATLLRSGGTDSAVKCMRVPSEGLIEAES